jgi:integrase
VTALRESLTAYLATRRALGARLRWPASALPRFLDFLEEEGAARITTPLAVRWARRSTGAQPATQAGRLSMVRQFAAWCAATDPLCEVPPTRLLRAGRRRPVPHIFGDDELARLMAAAARLPSRVGLHPRTYAALVGVMAATGLRPGEAVRLARDDADLAAGVLTVRESKRGKSRIVPLHESTRSALAAYAACRDRLRPRPTADAFFLDDRGRGLCRAAAQRTFVRLCAATGVRPPVSAKRVGRGARLQDLRHTFATRRLIAWYRSGADVGRELPLLSAYLGHESVVHTYWYVQAVPELLRLATERSAAQDDGKGRA